VSEVRKKFVSINQKLIFYTIVASTILTTATTIFTFVLDYNSEVDIQNAMLEHLEKTNISSIEHGIWDLDEELLTKNINALIQIPSIISVGVYDQTKKIIVSESIKDQYEEMEQYSKIKDISISKKRNQTEEIIGYLKVQYTQFHFYKKILNRLFILFLTQLLKTFAVSFVLLYMFKRLLSNDLVAIVSFCSEQLKNNNDYLQTIHFKQNSKKTEDEFILIENSLNELIQTINKSKRETKKELELKESALHQLSHLAALGEMAGNVGHEINNPLAIIKGSIYRIRKDIKLENNLISSKITDSLDRIDNTSDRILKISKSLSTLARSQKDEDAQIESIGDIVEEAVSLIDEKMKLKKINFKYEVKKTDINVLVNRIQIGQVLFNLMNNAVYAVKDDNNNWINLIVENNEENVILKIIDSGGGISKEVQSNLFIPFFTTKKVGEGTGLGLSIAMKIMKEHKGEIYIDTKAKNTTFCVSLPIQKSKIGKEAS
jgi:C4-dicarboxylate-specific signal transduction histidine kinase